MTEWSHLPNAKYIDRILDHVIDDPAARSAVMKAEWDAEWDAARSAAWSAACSAARDAEWDAARSASRSASRSAILALVAWDHAGALLDLPAEQVRVLALLGQPAAILIYPTVLAMENSPKSLIINKIDLVDQ